MYPTPVEYRDTPAAEAAPPAQSPPGLRGQGGVNSRFLLFPPLKYTLTPLQQGHARRGRPGRAAPRAVPGPAPAEGQPRTLNPKPSTINHKP